MGRSNREESGKAADEAEKLRIVIVPGYDDLLARDRNHDATMGFAGPAVFPGTPSITVEVPWPLRSREAGHGRARREEGMAPNAERSRECVAEALANRPK